MRRRSQKTSPLFIIVFVLAFVLAFLARQFLPVPTEFKNLLFFLLLIGISWGGVAAIAKIRKR